MKREVRPGRSADGGPEDQTHGCIYVTASPVEPGAAGYRGQPLIVRRPGDGAETTRRRPIRRGSSRRNPEPGPVARRTAAAAD